MPRRSLRPMVALACALVGSAGLSACGGASETIVAQVGHSTVTLSALRHWTTVLGTGQTRTLEFLISSDWSLQEAARQHLQPSTQAVAQLVEQQRTSVQGEIGKELGGTPASEADLHFQAQAKLAASRLREKLLGQEPAIGAAQVAQYYRQHNSDFLVAEVRYFDIDNLKSQAAALQVRREVQSGSDFARMSLNEVLSSGLGNNPGRYAIRRAIFAAKPNVLSGPVLLSDVGDHSLFEVTRIVPAHLRPLADVRGEIEARLRDAWQRLALSEYATALRVRWTPQTRCSAGYVVKQCRR